MTRRKTKLRLIEPLPEPIPHAADHLLPRHGGTPAVPFVPFNSDDPEMWNVTVDLHAWSEAHPCDCNARCKCES